MHRTGLGYQAIARELSRLGIATSRGSVERLVKGLPPYDGARMAQVLKGVFVVAEAKIQDSCEMVAQQS